MGVSPLGSPVQLIAQKKQPFRLLKSLTLPKLSILIKNGILIKLKLDAFWGIFIIEYLQKNFVIAVTEKNKKDAKRFLFFLFNLQF